MTGEFRSSRRSSRRDFLKATAGAALALAATVSAVGGLLTLRRGSRSTATLPTEQELNRTLQALQQNSRDAVSLLEQLQREVGDRTRTAREIETQLQELQRQRKLLELSPEQRKGLEDLVRRKQTLGDMFTSSDFWVGRVLLSTVFFLAGVLFTL
jgi:chromosome segregation ATPase